MVAPSFVRPSPSSLEDRYERHAGFHVLRLGGTDEEMGYQHGWLLREVIPHGPLPAFARHVARLLGQSGLLGAVSGASGLLGAALGRTVGRQLEARYPERARAALRGLAAGAGLDEAELMRAVTMPDTFLWAVEQYKKRRHFLPAPRFGVPTFGCTSVLGWGDATTTGELLHGRNFDYHGVGTWDAEPVVAFHAPSDGQPYVALSSAGVLLGGITAMNEAGLTLGVHQHLAAAEVDLGGTPIGVLGDQIMRHARTLDDARRMLDDHRPSAAWTYVIGSALERSVLCYELTPQRRALVWPEGDTFAYTNIFLARRLEGLEHLVYPTGWRHNTGRFHLATRRLRERHGQLDAAAIADILGDPGDPRDRLRNAIATLETVASAVFAPGRGLLYAATGSSPVSQNPYVAFDLTTGRPRPDVAPLPGHEGDPSARRALGAYREAYQQHFQRGDVALARRLVRQACDEQPAQPSYAFVAGLLALEQGDDRDAEALLDRAVALGHPDPEREAAFHLWRGRVRDLLGRRADARSDYARAASGDPDVREAAARQLRQPWRRARPAIEWSFGDTMAP